MNQYAPGQADEDGLVFNIQSFSIADGPGVRTTVFLSGCNLRCLWCHNPESWEKKPALRFLPEKCIGCGACFAVCPHDAHVTKDGVHLLLRERCDGCGACADICYSGALGLTGQRMSAGEVFARIRADEGYFRHSGGGVTFSGGECMLQAGFLEALLRLCREARINTAVDTAGHVPYERLQRVLPWTDLFLYDLKAGTPALHQKLTGVDGELIWNNLGRLLADGAAVTVRVPCIKGGNWEELGVIAQRLAGLPVRQVELLPYHRLGEGKFQQLGLTTAAFAVPSNQEMADVARLFASAGRDVKYTEQ